MSDLVLDVRGKICPIPVMKAAKVIHGLSSGQMLEILSTDPGAPEDLRVFCQTKGHSFLEESFHDGVHRILIVKGT